MMLSDRWQDYRVLDTGDGEKLERWGSVVLRRPDPQVIWPARNEAMWQNAQAHYVRSREGGGKWQLFDRLPESWRIAYDDLTFIVRPTGFKHTGLFPEQAVNWDWMRARIRAAEGPVRVLNLFGYTGGATLACAKEGASVVHVDAAKGMLQWGRDNLAASGLADAPVRWIQDDALKFVEREIRRGNTYHGILMDPPSYGRGPGGEVWKLEEKAFELVSQAAKLMDEKPCFFLINAYTTGLQPGVLANLIDRCLPKGEIIADEIGLPVEAGGVLPCGASGRWWR